MGFHLSAQKGPSFAACSFFHPYNSDRIAPNCQPGLSFPPLSTTVNSYSSSSNKNLRIYRRVDSDTSSKGRLTVRAAGGPCTRFHILLSTASIFGRWLQQIQTRTGGAQARTLAPSPKTAAAGATRLPSMPYGFDDLRQLSFDKSRVPWDALFFSGWNCQFC